MEWTHSQKEFWDDYSKDFRRPLWNADAEVSLCYTNNGQDCREQLERFASAAERCLDWLNAHQADIFAAIEEDGLYDDAAEAVEDMADSGDFCETAEEHGTAWLVLDKSRRIALPYRKEDFFRSLFIEGLSFSADFKSPRFIVDMFLGLEPNVFGDHSIEVFLEGSLDKPAYTLSVNGLAG